MEEEQDNPREETERREEPNRAGRTDQPEEEGGESGEHAGGPTEEREPGPEHEGEEHETVER